MRKGFLATWAQGRRRKHQGLLPAPVLRAAMPGVAAWDWNYANPIFWNAYNSLDGGVTWQYDDHGAGTDRTYMPDGGQHLMFIVGVDANGKEITQRSNPVRPDDGIVPLTVAGLKLWARVESLVGTANNASVGTWVDDSGLGRNLVQATAGRKPLYVASVQGGPAVQFDGGDDVLATAVNVLNTDQHTIFLVARPLSTGSNDAVGTGNVVSGDILLMVAYGDRQRGTNWRGANSNLLDGATPLHDAAFAIFEQEVTATQITLRLNGVTDATQAMAGVPAGLSKPIYLGSRLNSWFFNGYVRALLVYEGNPSAADKARIRDFLHYTYAVPFPYPAPPPPGAPFDFGASPDGGDAYLWWDLSDARYATGVEIERKLTSAPDSSFVVIATIGLDTEYYDPGIAPQSMTYRARAFNAGGYSGYSNTASVNF